MRVKNILFVLGIVVFLYPTISDWWNSFHQSLVISRYEERMTRMDEKMNLKWKEQALLYNKKKEKEFMTELSAEEQKEYRTVLSMYEDGLIGYIEIPVIDLKLPFYHGTEDSVLQIGAGHMEGTSFPVGGTDSHCVLSGHRGLPSARLFTGLDQLKEGDIFHVCVLNEEYHYRIERIQTVLPEETNRLKIEKGKDLCTLVTCTPYGINSHRLLITGIRVERREDMGQIEESFVDKSEILKERLWMKGKKAVKWAVLCLFVAAFCFSSKREVRAEEKPAVSEKVWKENQSTYEIEMHYKFPGVTFWLYQIEEEGKDQDLDSLKPFRTGDIDESGLLVFSDLPKGRYIIRGEKHIEQGIQYVPVMTEIQLPMNDSVHGGKIIVTPKFEKIPDEISTEDKTEESTEEKVELEEMLPQTGQPWLMVMILSILGTFLLILAGMNGFRG